MKRSFPVIFLMLFLVAAPLLQLWAQKPLAIAATSRVDFTIGTKYSGKPSIVKGTFGKVQGTIIFDEVHPEKSVFDVSVPLSSLSTGKSDLDAELKESHFFDMAFHPVIRFRSSSVAADGTGGKIYVTKGVLQMKGVSKPVSIQFMAMKVGSGYVFKGSFNLSRLLFGIGDRGDADERALVFINVKTSKG